MPFLFVTPEKIETVVDEKTGELKTLRLNCTELAPRNFNVNLIKQPAHIRNQLQQFVDQKQPIMIPLKEGKTSDGQVYFQLESGQIIPVSMDYVKQLQSQNDPVSTQKTVVIDNTQTEPTHKTKELKFG